jgi:anti-sigma factor ChrR (cupin superfamily)
VTAPGTLYVDAASRPWTEARPRVPWKVLWEDGDRRTMLLRSEPCAVIPRHRHLGDEQIFVLEGSVSVDTGTRTAGNDARRPPGCAHTVTSPGGALVLTVISGGGTEPLA